MPNSALAGLFATLSDLGQRTPNTVMQIEEHADRKKARERDTLEYGRKEKARTNAENVFTNIPVLGAQLGGLPGGPGVDLTQFGQPGQPAPANDMLGLLGTAAPGLKIGADAPFRPELNPPAPVAPPEKVGYRTQADYVRSNIRSPEDLTMLEPYLRALDSAADAQEKGDERLAKAHAEQADRELQMQLTLIREAGADRRNNQDNATSRSNNSVTNANKLPPKKDYTQMSLPELGTTLAYYKAQQKELGKKQEAVTPVSVEGKSLQKQQDEIAKQLVLAGLAYKLAGGTEEPDHDTPDPAAHATGGLVVPPVVDPKVKLATEALADPNASAEVKRRALEILQGR